MRPWCCDICLKFSSTSPFSLEAIAEESIQKKGRNSLGIFYLHHNFLEKRIWLRFSARPESGTTAHKIKKRITAATHWMSHTISWEESEKVVFFVGKGLC
jgi:hypothetical protein